MKLSKTIGIKLRAIRELRNWSQTQMAEFLGYESLNGYSNIERGSSVPSLHSIEKFAEKLEISIIDFLFFGDLELQYCAFHKALLSSIGKDLAQMPKKCDHVNACPNEEGFCVCEDCGGYLK